MKAIAAVTMFFLPGTFAASIVAMPIFQWTAPAGGDVVGQRIGVYWAVAVALTLCDCGLVLPLGPSYEQNKVDWSRAWETKVGVMHDTHTYDGTLPSRATLISSCKLAQYH